MEAEKLMTKVVSEIGMVAQCLQAEENANRTAGYCAVVVLVSPTPGSFRSDDTRQTKVQALGEVHGSIADRMEMLTQVIKDIPLEFWPVIMQRVYGARQERMEYELENEPNGISPSLVPEAEIVGETPAILERIREIFKR